MLMNRLRGKVADRPIDILVPQLLEMKPDSKVCPNFLRHDESGGAWKPL